VTPWKGERKDSWASNPNLAVYVFVVLFIVWLAFQIWARLPNGPPPPTGLDPMVMAALGVAITAKSHERRAREDEIQRDVEKLKEVAKEKHPDKAEELGGEVDG
jgi:hypothetical protein